ncbi:MAG: helix-turn-helix transcriptional regulator [Blautia sp.]|nr:helix-turn-helix transcriptional regulator [Blautia sp.]
MIIKAKTSLTLGDNSEELLSEDAGGLPFVCQYDESERFAGRHIPWHWHEWVEINYLEEGGYLLHTTDETMEVGQGEAVFLNGNVLHSYDFPEKVNYYSCIFDTRFLAGEYGSYLEQKYFAPILRSRSLPVVHIRPDSARGVHMISCLLEMIDALREEPRGYEFKIRETMSRFFLLLLEETEGTLSREEAGLDRDMERMKQMLQYIYSHYMEPIGLPDIAKAAGISPRECTRCFGRAIDRPPIRFLIEYRAQMAAMKLSRTGDSISSIAEQCGFLSDSYFGKVFKEIYGCTPREYRKRK